MTGDTPDHSYTVSLTQLEVLSKVRDSVPNH